MKDNLNFFLHSKTISSIYFFNTLYRVWARFWSLGDNLSPWLKFWGTFLFLGGQKFVHPSADAKGFVFLMSDKNSRTSPPFHSATTCDLVIFFGFLWSSSVSSWLIHCSSSVSFFSDSLWLWFGTKQLSNVRTRFRCDMLTIARRVHHAWLEAVRAWNVCVQ